MEQLMSKNPTSLDMLKRITTPQFATKIEG
jgi:hypothetical protein